MASIDRIISETKKEEGGLSRSKTDSASAHPSGCQITSGGVSASDWHTNKGVTWDTFISNASNLGYEANCRNFEVMPDNIWRSIAKKGYWDPFYLDQYNSQAIANFIFQWAWGSGVNGAYRQLAKLANMKYGMNLSTSYSLSNAAKLKDKFNEVSKRNESGLLLDLKNSLKGFYVSLNQPANEAGWLKRVDELYEMSLNEISNVGKLALHNIGKVLIGAALISATIYVIVRISKSKNS